MKKDESEAVEEEIAEEQVICSHFLIAFCQVSPITDSFSCGCRCLNEAYLV